MAGRSPDEHQQRAGHRQIRGAAVLNSYLDETSTCSIDPGKGRCSTVEKPAARNIAWYSFSVYASPSGVVASIIKPNSATIGGVTRSSFGTNSRVMTRPLG